MATNSDSYMFFTRSDLPKSANNSFDLPPLGYSLHQTNFTMITQIPAVRPTDDTVSIISPPDVRADTRDAIDHRPIISNFRGMIESYSDLPDDPPDGSIYLVGEDRTFYIYGDGHWDLLPNAEQFVENLLNRALSIASLRGDGWQTGYQDNSGNRIVDGEPRVVDVFDDAPNEYTKELDAIAAKAKADKIRAIFDERITHRSRKVMCLKDSETEPIRTKCRRKILSAG